MCLWLARACVARMDSVPQGTSYRRRRSQSRQVGIDEGTVAGQLDGLDERARVNGYIWESWNCTPNKIRSNNSRRATPSPCGSRRDGFGPGRWSDEPEYSSASGWAPCAPLAPRRSASDSSKKIRRCAMSYDQSTVRQGPCRRQCIARRHEVANIPVHVVGDYFRARLLGSVSGVDFALRSVRPSSTKK